MADEDLRRRLEDPGFTPPRTELAAVLELVASGDERTARLAERSLLRARETALEFLLAALPSSPPALLPKAIGLLGRLARELGDERALEAVLQATRAGDPKARKSAILALGKIRDPRIEPALLALWPDASAGERRALLAALGKSGGEAALALLDSLGKEADGDAALERIARRGRLMLERTTARSGARIVKDRALPARYTVIARSRAGLSGIMAEELSTFAAATVHSARDAVLEFGGELGELYRCRTALEFGIVLPLGAGPIEAAVAQALTSAAALAALRAWSDGQPTFRARFAGGGHRRASVWRIAELVRAHASALRNDPTRATWEVEIDERRRRVLLLPRALQDPRFGYRKRDVPAASHPTIAAALARVASGSGAYARGDETVWDPFCGSGLELVERGLLGRYRTLVGSDTSTAALDAARENLAAASLGAELVCADARHFAPEGVTLVITNPPMGRRVARGELTPLLADFFHHVAAVLGQRGRLVWLSPLPERTARLGSELGLGVKRLAAVDLGGFEAELQMFARGRLAHA